MALPTSICIKSVHNNKYLRYRHEQGDQFHGLLQFSGDKVIDPSAQFEVEKAKTYNGLVHLKSRHNNRYLVRWSPHQYWITAGAFEPIEDQSSWTCTLFKPIIVQESCSVKKIRLLHVQLNQYAFIGTFGAPVDLCMFAGLKDPDTKNSSDVFIIVNLDAVYKLPKYVAFKGDNGKYLGANPIKGQQLLQFSFDSPHDPKVQQEIFLSPDGTIFIKSSHYGKFWSLGDGNWIVANADDPRRSNNPNYMFRPAIVDINVVALFNMARNYFCKRLIAQDKYDYLSADTKSIDQWARLQVVDLGSN